MKRKTKQLIGAFVLGALTASAGFGGYMVYHYLDARLDAVVTYLQVMGGGGR